MDYLSMLNAPQREGVVNTEGPCMLIAGAGSGKTRVLTYRIAHLIKSKEVDPFNILALTFTNKAAGEMRERIEKVVGTEARNLWMGTFHAVFARVLRAESHRLGYPNNFTIYDTEDTKSLLKTIIKEMGLDEKIYKPNVVLYRISGAKNRLISWQEYLQNPVYREDDESAMKPRMGEIYKNYVERCFKSSAMDFDDLLFNTYLLFKNHIDVLNKYQHRFHYVLIDEFQDTNLPQYHITKRLASVHQNICVVGDDAQSIYAFRGANIQNILNFEKDYPDLKIIKLEQNYRSTQNIVNAANSVIGHNKAQLKKEVWTINPPGELIEVIRANSDNHEAELVAYSIIEEKVNKYLSNTDFAILYRTNSQSRAIEEALRRRNINYRIIGGFSFYQRKEIKNIIAYLKFMVNRNDEESFRRIINLPKRGIGQATVDKIVVAAYEHDIAIWEVLLNIDHFLSGRAAKAVGEFADMIKSFEQYAVNKDAYEVANNIAKRSGLLKALYEDKTIEGLSRYENVQELLNSIKEFVDDPENNGVSLGEFLQQIALLTDADNDKAANQDCVTLMTIHAAKGLEFRSVYVVGMEEDLFPSQMLMSSRADLEEERRLFYVAITRAKEKLVLSHARARYRYGNLKSCDPSRFLEEIDPAYLKTSKKTGRDKVPVKTNYTKKLVSSIKKSSQGVSSYKHTPSADFHPDDTSGLTKGMKVEHAKFGFGTVMLLEEEGSHRKAKVQFEHFGEKTLLLSFAKLKIYR